MSFFAFFRRKSTHEVDPSLKQRLTALEDRWNAIETEWTEWYEKFRLLHLRLAKRQKAIELAESQETPPAPTVTEPTNGTPVDDVRGFGLTEHQRAVQQQILRQRARG